MRTTRGHWRWVVAVGLLLALVWWVEVAFGWRKVLGAWSSLRPADLGGVLALVSLGYIARARRIGQHFGPPLSEYPWQCFRVMALHNALNNLLPARTGEISFPVLLAREFGIGASRSIAALLWLRLLDLGVLLGIAAATLGVMWYGAGLGVGVAAGVLAIPYLGWSLLQRGEPGPGILGALRRRVRAGLPATRRALTACLGWTFLHWGAKLLAYAWLLHRYVDLPSVPAVLGAIAGELTSVLPVHGLAGAGTYEGGMLLVLRPLGVDLERAVIGAVNLHLFLLAVSITVALGVLMIRGRRPATELLHRSDS